MSENNWGRWGSDDEAGALNLVTSEVTRLACSLVRTGRIVVLGQPLGPGTVVPTHRKRIERFMVRDGGDYAAGARTRGGFQFAEDVVSFAAHSGTHIDALSHAWYDDQIYNGYPASGVRSTTGAQKCGAEQLHPIVTRGVLLDVAAIVDEPLSAGAPINTAHLVAATRNAGVELRPGDVVLVRTGWYGSVGDREDEYLDGEPGIDLGAAHWLATAGVSVVGADNLAIEVMPFLDDVWFPVHQFLLRDQGIPLIEGMVLDELAKAEASEFLFIASPLPLVGSTAGPVCPLAVL